MSLRRTLAWTFVAVIGLATAGGITIVASKLSNPRIGLLSEPLSAGVELAPQGGPLLAPPAARPPHHHRHRNRRGDGGSDTGSTSATSPSVTPPATTSLVAAPGDDQSGRSRGGDD